MFLGFDLQSLSGVAAIDVLSRGRCADTCTHAGSDCQAAVFNVSLNRCYTKTVDASEMVAVLDVNLALRLEVIDCYGAHRPSLAACNFHCSPGGIGAGVPAWGSLWQHLRPTADVFRRVQVA